MMAAAQAFREGEAARFERNVKWVGRGIYGGTALATAGAVYAGAPYITAAISGVGTALSLLAVDKKADVVAKLMRKEWREAWQATREFFKRESESVFPLSGAMAVIAAGGAMSMGTPSGP